MPSAVALFDDALRLVACSPAWQARFDLPPAPAAPLADAFADPDGAWAATLRRCLRDGAAARGHARPLARRDGTDARPVRWEARPAPLDASGDSAPGGSASGGPRSAHRPRRRRIRR